MFEFRSFFFTAWLKRDICLSNAPFWFNFDLLFMYLYFLGITMMVTWSARCRASASSTSLCVTWGLWLATAQPSSTAWCRSASRRRWLACTCTASVSPSPPWPWPPPPRSTRTAEGGHVHAPQLPSHADWKSNPWLVWTAPMKFLSFFNSTEQKRAERTS